MTFEEKVEKIIEQTVAIGYQEDTPDDEDWYEKEIDMRVKQILKAHQVEIKGLVREIEKLDYYWLSYNRSNALIELNKAIEIIKKRIDN